MNNISINNNQENIQNNIQAKISFRKDMKTLSMKNHLIHQCLQKIYNGTMKMGLKM